MGLIFFLFGAIIEIGLAAFCIYTRSYQKQAISITRLAAFAAFTLSIALFAVQWSFRYYALAVMLCILAIFSAVSLLRKKPVRKEFRIRRIVIRAVLMTALLFIVTLPAIVFPQYQKIAPTGPYGVAAALYTYTDNSRTETYTDTAQNRKLNVEFWYPAGTDGVYPLIVFSHGSLGIKTSNETLFQELASHGYVVCSIDHTYQCFFTTGADGKTALLNLGFFNELSLELNSSDKQFSYECYQKWMKIRMGDIDFVISRILSEAAGKDADAVYRLVDTAKIGVMGHSLGGSAALGIGRTRNDVKAVIALESPFMYDIQGVRNDTFVFRDAVYPVPLLNVYSDDSWSHLGQWPEYAQNYALLDTPLAYNVLIRGTGHLSLTDLALVSPFLTDMLNRHRSYTDTAYCLKTINRICLSFFDCTLKGTGSFSSGIY